MRAEASRRSIKSVVKAGAGIAVVISALVAIALILAPHEMQRIASKPIEGRLIDRPAVAIVENTDEEVQGIDWAYWQDVNPDIAGWITIPGTPIDYPIVQASFSDPTHYLNYDIYGSYNIYGCPYVDASCTIVSPNTIIFAHNMGGIDDAMFTQLTNYFDPGFMATHEAVIIQTPDAVYNLKVRAAERVSPYGFAKQTEFGGVEGLREYYLERWQDAAARCEQPESEQIDKLFTLITCENGGAARAVVYVG
jgi:sortase B